MLGCPNSARHRLSTRLRDRVSSAFKASRVPICLHVRDHVRDSFETSHTAKNEKGYEFMQVWADAKACPDPVLRLVLFTTGSLLLVSPPLPTPVQLPLVTRLQASAMLMAAQQQHCIADSFGMCS